MSELSFAFRTFDTTSLLSKKATDRLLLLPARNDLETLALFDAAVRGGCSIGVVSEDILKRLPCRPLDDRSGRLHVLDSEWVPAERLACFTSGSTGGPKGILRTVESWRASFRMQRALFGYGRDANTLVLGSLAHSMHLYGVAEALDRGVVPLTVPRFMPRRVAELCRDRENLILYATPAHLYMLAAFAHKHGDCRLPSVTHVLCGGAKLDPRRYAAIRGLFPAARVVEYFGTTETSFITHKTADAPAGSVGTPCPTVSIMIRDDDGGPVPPGRTGTLWVKSPMLFERYVVGSDPNTQWHDGYVTIGDQGFLDDAGHFTFTARKSSMVTVAGTNVYTDVIEEHLRSLLPLEDVVVVAVRDAMRGRCLVAATPTPLDDHRKEAALRALRRKFGPLLAPRRLLNLPDWPVLPSGKTDRRTIARRATNGGA